MEQSEGEQSTAGGEPSEGAGEQSDGAGERDESRGEKPKGKPRLSGWDPKWVEKNRQFHWFYSPIKKLLFIVLFFFLILLLYFCYFLFLHSAFKKPFSMPAIQ